jgi:signal transduction histidine kinase
MKNTFLQKLNFFLNPLVRLGVKKYSILFSLILNIAICIISEIFAYGIARNPNIVGSYIIFINVALIIYFSFRDGIRGGFIATIITILYYFYIIITRKYVGTQFITGVETTLMLGLTYAMLAIIIGWLKQRIDMLIQQEMQAKYSAEEEKARLQIILDQLPVGILLTDTQGNLEGNKQLEKIIGKKIISKLNTDETYKSLYAYKANKSLSPKEWPIVRALTKGETIYAEEMEYIRDDKKLLHLRINAAPIRNRNKRIISAVSTLYDITQEKELEQRKDDFINMASHELKTPLTSMKLYLELLLKRIKTYDDEKATKTLVSIKTQTEKLQGLANDLLDVSRIQTGKLHFVKETFDLTSIIEETVELLQETTNRHKITFVGKNTCIVYADRFRMYQVLTNLITNAIKYSPTGKEIIVKAKPENEKVVISVQDFGIGIAHEQKNKIFDRLYQVTEAKAKTFPGLGMGLYISKEIIKRHKGKIWVESEKGKGSTFYFSLPIKK